LDVKGIYIGGKCVKNHSRHRAGRARISCLRIVPTNGVAAPAAP
jgi:hypothetical protein